METPDQFIRRGKAAAIERSEAAGDGIPADAVVANLGSKVDAARQRGTISCEPGVPSDALAQDLNDDEAKR